MPPRVTPWTHVYRVNWYTNGILSWSRRTTKSGAFEWAETYRSNKAYRLSQGQEWNDGLRIERAPVGIWSEIMVRGQVEYPAPQSNQPKAEDPLDGLLSCGCERRYAVVNNRHRPPCTIRVGM